MSTTRGTRFHCTGRQRRAREDVTVFILVLLNDIDGEPAEHYPLTDPYYACGDAHVCGCPLAPASRKWKVEGTIPGGAFDGRVRGVAPLGIRTVDEAHRFWEHNVIRPLEMAEPRSAYAVVTPDGLWHECVDPEPQDFFIGRRKDLDWRDLLPHDQPLTARQVAWRFQVADLLVRYQHCWLMGMDATLSLEPPRACRAEDEFHGLLEETY